MIYDNGTEGPTIIPTIDTVSKPGGGFINAHGKYKGKIKQAYLRRSASGALMIWLDFLSDGGQKALLSSCLENKSGVLNPFGVQLLHDLSVCMRRRQNVPIQGTYYAYDANVKTNVPENGTIYPDLCGDIGFVITTEDGGRYKNLNVYTTFCPKTELTAYEIVQGQTEAKALANVIARLTAENSWHKTKALTPPNNPYAQNTAQMPQNQVSNQFNQFDDDVPF